MVSSMSLIWLAQYVVFVGVQDGLVGEPMWLAPRLTTMTSGWNPASLHCFTQ